MNKPPMKLRNPISRLFSTITKITTTTTHQSQQQQNLINTITELQAHLIRTKIQTNPSFTDAQSFLNSAIRDFSHTNQPIKAIHTYDRMRALQLAPPSSSTFLFVFKACGRIPDVKHGLRIHLHCLKLGFDSYVLVCNGLIHMYSVCGEMGFARKVFDVMGERDLVSWNSLICGYSLRKSFREVLGVFEAMRLEKVTGDAVTMVKVVLACGYLGDHELANSMVRYIEEKNVVVDVYLGNTLMDLYGRRGNVHFARRAFDQMGEKNLVSWNTMIVAYTKAGDLDSARNIFNEMPVRDVISWTSLIVGYSQMDRFSESVTLFREMMKAKMKPDEITVTSVLSACAHLGSLDIGKAVHDYICGYNIHPDICVGNALIYMYFKCGSTKKALEVFKEMVEKDTVSWTSVITGLAINGYSIEAIDYFSRMLSEGVKPRDVTYIGVLQACAYAGLVDKGLEYFESMVRDYKIEPKMKHYGCMVDLLSRAGSLERAYEIIKNMPVEPDAIVWRILLSACKLYGNVDLAEIATRKLLELDPSCSGNYVLLSNTYAAADRWDDAMKMRHLMNESDIQKATGCSSIELNSSVHMKCCGLGQKAVVKSGGLGPGGSIEEEQKHMQIKLEA
ncbi:hypothetical protein GIB67_037789 [Kingdonia uniflora]|uniref:Pentatricopeptide repeat-containing protein n=1 Tax=Kingdonia uniflora TaxID=39325 RepID=A0A7J7LV80_9MAGN|nr:hypothetical protein GIB67_037789 [Kingdonia uniflora]